MLRAIEKSMRGGESDILAFAEFERVSLLNEVHFTHKVTHKVTLLEIYLLVEIFLFPTVHRSGIATSPLGRKSYPVARGGGAVSAVEVG